MFLISTTNKITYVIAQNYDGGIIVENYFS